MAIFTENFEGITATANSPYSTFYDEFLLPGFLSAYTFASGVHLASPIPNDSDLILLGDLAAQPKATWGLLSGRVDPEHLPPSGSSYLGVNDETDGSIEFSFSTDVYTVGGFVLSYGAHNRMAAYDASGELISGASIRSVSVDDWETNYIQVVSNVPIAKVVFTGDYLVIDDLTFDTSKPHVAAGSGKADVMKSVATDNADFIFGKGGADKIKAKGGDDTVNGGNGADKVHGGDGNDTIIVGKGGDKVWGDAGQDSMLFRELGFVTKLKDFDAADDTILLDKAAFASLALGSLTDAQFQAGAAAADAEDRIIYDASNGRLSFDADGAGGVSAIQIAQLSAGLALTAADFFVV